MLFNFALQYAVSKVQEIQVGQKLNGIHHMQFHADNVNLVGDNIYNIKKNSEALMALVRMLVKMYPQRKLSIC
jgi:hypothetical protein